MLCLNLRYTNQIFPTVFNVRLKTVMWGGTANPAFKPPLSGLGTSRHPLGQSVSLTRILVDKAVIAMNEWITNWLTCISPRRRQQRGAGIFSPSSATASSSGDEEQSAPLHCSAGHVMMAPAIRGWICVRLSCTLTFELALKSNHLMKCRCRRTLNSKNICAYMS